MKGYVSFYKDFYGYKFARHFRRPSDWKISQTQYTVKTPQLLYLHVAKNSGIHRCFVSTYDYGTVDNLKHKNRDYIILDRVFFDFDVHNLEAKNLTEKLEALRRKGRYYSIDLQSKLITKLRNLIINEKITEPAINEAKEFSRQFKMSFGKYPALFFSGAKGCHAYCFMEPVKLENPNETIQNFAEMVKSTYNFKTLDLKANKNALSRISRVPYSKHQLTGLAVVPFKISDSYDEIINKSLDPVIEPFQIQNHLTRLDEYLKDNDTILTYNKNLKKETDKNKLIKKYPGKYKIKDHRKWFKSILGEPEIEYMERNLYRCPFSDHDDSSPSFNVYDNGYYCYGCLKYGNYWQFLKEYNGWTDSQVRNFLAKKK